jgi:hypothetical protein
MQPFFSKFGTLAPVFALVVGLSSAALPVSAAETGQKAFLAFDAPPRNCSPRSSALPLIFRVFVARRERSLRSDSRLRL